MSERQTTFQASERLFPAALLTVVGGFLDAYTYLSRGGVFANAQTGNIVLLGIRLAQGAWREALAYLVPIAAFALGVLVAEGLRQIFRTHPRLHWRQVVVGVECLLLLGVSLVPAGDWNTVVNTSVSFLCAMQVQSFRKLEGSAYATTMCTGNLRSGTELLWQARLMGDPVLARKGLCYFGIIGCFILGAVLGVLLTEVLGTWSVLCCLVPLAAVFFTLSQPTSG